MPALKEKLPCREKWEETKANATAAALFLKQDTQKRAQAIHVSRNIMFNSSAKDLAAQWKEVAHEGKKKKTQQPRNRNLFKLILEGKYFRNYCL